MGFIVDLVVLVCEGIVLYLSDVNFFGVSSVFLNNDVVKEDIIVVYFQVYMSGEFGGMLVNFLVGVCYEKIDVILMLLVIFFSYLIWENNNDFSLYIDLSIDIILLLVKVDYDYLLFSLDFDIMLIDDVKVCFFYSKMIVWVGYGDLCVLLSGFGILGLMFNGICVIVSLFNLVLLLLELDNFDVFVEWYFEENSYVFVGFFEKCVVNFIGIGQEDCIFFGIFD